jgi:hypothetical protein
MKIFKILFILSSILWCIFSYKLLFEQDLIKFVKFGILFIAVLIEELYYLIEEKVLKHGNRIV